VSNWAPPRLSSPSAPPSLVVSADPLAKIEAVRLAAWATLLLTALFYAPALLAGYMADDHYHLLVVGDLKQAFREGWNLFGFVRSPEEVRIHRDWGTAPWWTSDSFRIDFYRPIPSITHWLDHALFGPNAAAAHLVSIGWYLLTIALVHRVFVRFLGASSRTLLLAIMIFAIDDTHALAVQWIANRSDLIAGAFLLTAFLGWLRLRERRGSRGVNLVMIFGGTVAALLSKESSVVLPVLVLAHALLVPDRPGMSLRDRLRAHRLVHLALCTIAIAYVGLYFAAGHGPNTLYYLNPTRSPGMWAQQLVRSGFFHAVILATGVPLHVLSSSPVRDHPIVAGLLAALTVAFWALVWRFLRRDRTTRFFVAWMILAQLVLTTSFPDPRLLFLPSIGFSCIVARLMQVCWQRRAEWQPAKAVVVVLGALHLVVAPVLVQACLHVVNGFQDGYALLRQGVRENVDVDRLPTDGEGVEVFFLDCHQRESTALSNLYLLRHLPAGADVRSELARDDWTYTEKLDRAFGKLRIHYYSLSFLTEPIDVRVLNDHELTIAPRTGSYFPTLFEQLYLTSSTFHVGQTFVLPSFTATIDALNAEGEVVRVRFTFEKRLDSPSYRFLSFDGARWSRVTFEHPQSLSNAQ
jgi:hypothetical protein